MIEVKNLTKSYTTGDTMVEALKNVSFNLRDNEFVSILGQSGCGKTTLLNVLGGLDQYDSGDIIINGKSTKEYKDRDWDTYRNHYIGFIFQSYNLIPHLTVLENVEIALTLSGVSKKERKQRAFDVLKRVGLEDKVKNKPNQLSGGQMQRVAIARALVNNPEIILADEPTGALDTESSIQVMDILKEVAKEKLVVMVTHNPELAEKYSTRIIRFLDGSLQSDTNPYNEGISTKQEDISKISNNKEFKKKRMSFFTALTLSFKNLLTKKTRTILTSFAGSIGIIGIALILAISSGFNSYVSKIQEDTLSTYPVEITNSSYDLSSLMKIFMSSGDGDNTHEKDAVYINSELTEMLEKFNSSSTSNDLSSFKSYLDGEGKEEISKYVSAIQYSYNINLNAYYDSADNGLVQANPTTVFSDVISAYPHTNLDTKDKIIRYSLLNYMFGSTTSYYKNEFWSEMLDNTDLLKSQYELVNPSSRWATEYNEVMIVVDKHNEIDDYTLYGLGLLNQNDLETLLDNYINNVDSPKLTKTFSYEDLLNIEYKLILECDYFEKQTDGTYLDIRTLKETDPILYKQKIQDLYTTKAIPVKITGIIREKGDASTHSIKSTIAYNSKLTSFIIEKTQQSEVVTSQLESNTINILTKNTFVADHTTKDAILTSLGYSNLNDPQAIYIYPKNFDCKEEISDFINDYNQSKLSNGEDEKVITYSDTVGTMMSSISTIISSISYVLIAFVSVSLVVSSIMIGIITYISVIERIKEIGILRSVGASKKDIKHVFTAESFIVGLLSGVLGITITYLLIIPINIILKSLTDISGIAYLPILAALILVAISIFLTFIAGSIPARLAAKKDPVRALRSE